jgi:outer membrane protein assembly factor BamB
MLEGQAERAQGLAAASSYELQWMRRFELRMGRLGSLGATDDAGTLWLMTYAGPGKPDEFLTRIEPDGTLSGRFDPIVPLGLDQWIDYLSIATSGDAVGLLANLVSGGREQISEGAFFIPVGRDGLGTPKRVAGRGPQFTNLIGNRNGQFIAPGDQEPLTILKLDANGSLVWRRSFTRNLVLPHAAVGTSGKIFVLSQGSSYIAIQVLDEAGRVIRSRRMYAKQGIAVADRDGDFSILFSKGVGGKGNRVYLTSFDQMLRQKLREVATPLVGKGGRTYQLIWTPLGHLMVGEGPEPDHQIMAEFDKSGRLIWQTDIPGPFAPLLIPFSTGFYVVADNTRGRDLTVEKYRFQ